VKAASLRAIAARGARLSISATYRDCHGARLWTDQSRRV